MDLVKGVPGIVIPSIPHEPNRKAVVEAHRDAVGMGHLVEMEGKDLGVDQQEEEDHLREVEEEGHRRLMEAEAGAHHHHHHHHHEVVVVVV